MLMQQIMSEQFAMDTDPTTIADVVVRQIDTVKTLPYSSRASMLLNDTFVLGYLTGFAEQACRYKHNGERHDQNAQYMIRVLREVLENPESAPAYATLSQSQENNSKFQHGCEIGQTDMNDWFLSLGRFLPVNLAEYLNHRNEVMNVGKQRLSLS